MQVGQESMEEAFRTFMSARLAILGVGMHRNGIRLLNGLQVRYRAPTI